MTVQRPTTLPDGLLVAFYGDDFTGSAAVMEVMSFAGLPTVLFLDVPSERQLRRFAHCRGVGIAGVARSQPPDWMERELPRIFSALDRLGAPITHYKVCSTLDSAPEVGSIGKAVDLAAPILARRSNPAKWIPFVVAAPAIGRYQAFGNLFARLAPETYRLDRHPVMRRHPVTPMDEADVRLHLRRQTDRHIGLVDLVALKQGRAQEALRATQKEGGSVVALDVVDEETLERAGALIWSERAGGLLAAGSQGIEYALVAHWRSLGLLPARPAPVPQGSAGRIAVVSGSVSSVTASQIGAARTRGFQHIALEAADALNPEAWSRAIDRAAIQAAAALNARQSPIVATALGPDDPAVARLTRTIAAAGASAAAVNQRIGEGLGVLLGRLIREHGLRRAAVLGGDSSGHALTALGIDALEAVAPIAPGCPLCRIHAEDPCLDGVEIALKGGQMGGPDILETIRAGGAIAQGSM